MKKNPEGLEMDQHTQTHKEKKPKLKLITNLDRFLIKVELILLTKSMMMKTKKKNTGSIIEDMKERKW